MARPVRIRLTYTGDRSKLARLEEAVEKDTRLKPEVKAEILDLIRKLIAAFMKLDAGLPPVMPKELSSRRRPE
jgi:hypothetical protein